MTGTSNEPFTHTNRSGRINTRTHIHTHNTRKKTQEVRTQIRAHTKHIHRKPPRLCTVSQTSHRPHTHTHIHWILFCAVFKTRRIHHSALWLLMCVVPSKLKTNGCRGCNHFYRRLLCLGITQIHICIPTHVHSDSHTQTHSYTDKHE